jgi:hypothetical protein
MYPYIPRRYIAFLRSVRRLLVSANVAPTSPILVTLVMEALRSSETSVLTRAVRRDIPENGTLQELKSLVKLADAFIRTRIRFLWTY